MQGFAAASEPDVHESVRTSLARMWDMVADVTGLDPVTVKSFLAFGMLLNNATALELGAPLITSVATTLHVSLDAAQWTLTIVLLTGTVAAPVVGRLGTGARRRTVVLGTLAVVAAGSVLTVLPLPFGVLLVGRAAQGCGLALTPLMMRWGPRLCVASRGK